MRFLLFALALCLCTYTAFSQIGTESSILGIVKDSSGAVLPKVNVVVTNQETGLSQTAGHHRRERFFPGPRLAARRIFRRRFTPPLQHLGTIRHGFDRGRTKRIQPALAVGDVKQSVSVQAGVELVQTERASVETAIEQKQIRDLPFNGRDPLQIVSLAPGMRYTGVGGNTLSHTVQGLGQHGDATQFSIDGMDANEPSTEGGIAFPNLDSVAQFRVQTSSFSAENGRQPIQVQMITKSGTNQYHGTLWEFLRNDALDARNTFAQSKPKLRRNQYGFSAGGPIVKNKTFFFTSFEGLRIRADTIYNQNAIPPAFLNGDFSSLKTSIIDPQTGKAFEGNQIPIQRFSNASKFSSPTSRCPTRPETSSRRWPRTPRTVPIGLSAAISS